MPDRGPLSCEELLEFEEYDRKRIAQFADLVRNYSGSSAPAEEFILGLVRYHSSGIPLTPDNVKEDLEEFRKNFEMTLANVRHFVRVYPELSLGAGEAVPTAAKAVATIASSEAPQMQQYNVTDDQQAARHLATARDFFKAFPDLVMAHSQELDSELQKLAE
jgi:hypothetical protein